MLFRDIFVVGEVVSVANPTEVVGVLFVAACELGRHPALNGLSHVLLGGYDDGQQDHDVDRVTVQNAVRNVVIVTCFRLRNPSNR